MWFLTADGGAAEVSESSGEQLEQPGHYSATTNNSPQDKESFVTEAALTNKQHCVIKLANALLPLCDDADAPLGERMRGPSFWEKPLCTFTLHSQLFLFFK